MSRSSRLLTLVAIFMSSATPASAGEEVSVAELVLNGADLADAEVVVEGELVGDYGFRGDGWMWSQLNGDAYVAAPLHEDGDPRGANVGVGLRVPSVLVSDLDPPGGYRRRGPLIRVVGTWRYHAADRQGESFLDVRSIEVLEPGRPFHHQANWWVIGAGILLLSLAAMIWLLRSRE